MSSFFELSPSQSSPNKHNSQKLRNLKKFSRNQSETFLFLLTNVLTKILIDQIATSEAQAYDTFVLAIFFVVHSDFVLKDDARLFFLIQIIFTETAHQIVTFLHLKIKKKKNAEPRICLGNYFSHE
jgi:hypothetical protein